MKHWMTWTLLASTLVLVAGCAPTRNYVIKSVDNDVALLGSEFHDFEYVSVKTQRDRLVVYGKIVHDHDSCESEGHVDLSVLRPDGTTSYEASLELRRQSDRVAGWAGAAFRAELPHQLVDGERVVLAFHQDDCRQGGVLDCKDNHATRVGGE